MALSESVSSFIHYQGEGHRRNFSLYVNFVFIRPTMDSQVNHSASKQLFMKNFMHYFAMFILRHKIMLTINIE
jgi:hypothetical protein